MRAWIVLVMVAGCMATPGPTTVHWDVSNDSPQSISYTILLEGRALHQENGSLQPGQQREHTMMASGEGLVAKVRLQTGAGEAVLTSFAEPSCDQHRLRAVWNGTWSLRWHSADC